MSRPSLLHTERFPLNTDCVEFCSRSNGSDIVVVGCYQLEPATNARAGGLHFLRLQSDVSDGSPLSKIGELAVPGVFDAKWSPSSQSSASSLLGVAAADGQLCIARVSPSGTVAIATSCHISARFLLSLAWRPKDAHILTSTSEGRLAYVEVTESDLTVLHSWKAHEMEIWCTTVDLHSADRVYTGSDDCCLKGWDLRMDNNAAAMTFADRRTHAAGVCTIASDPHTAFSLATGSYDDRLRLWDTRNTSKPVAVQQVSCGGGVWKIKYHPRRRNCIAAACMHDGFKLVTTDADGTWKILHEYKAHQSLAYGVDWYRGSSSLYNDVLASCSFYDSLLHIWNASDILHHMDV